MTLFAIAPLAFKRKRLNSKGQLSKNQFFCCVVCLFPFLYPASFLVFHFFVSAHTLASNIVATERQVPAPLQQTAAPGRRAARLGLP